jgi:hypothetical protein
MEKLRTYKRPLRENWMNLWWQNSPKMVFWKSNRRPLNKKSPLPSLRSHRQVKIRTLGSGSEVPTCAVGNRPTNPNITPSSQSSERNSSIWKRTSPENSKLGRQAWAPTAKNRDQLSAIHQARASARQSMLTTTRMLIITPYSSFKPRPITKTYR